MNGEYEWSESGLRLLQTIQKIVADNGGEEEMYLKMYVESNESSYKQNKVSIKSQVRTLKKNNVKHSVIMEVLNLTSNQLSQIVEDLRVSELKNYSNTYGDPDFLQREKQVKEQVRFMRLKKVTVEDIKDRLNLSQNKLYTIIHSLKSEVA